MTDFHLKTRSEKAREAFARAPKVMERHVDDGLSRGAQEVAREARRRVRKFLSTLTNSIRAWQVKPMHWRVSTGTNYARAVEEGTKPGYFPNPTNLIPWIKAHAGVRYGTTKPGTAARSAQYDEVRDRAWRLARSIHRRGTRAHPFMGPAADVKTARVHQLVEEATDRGIREVFG